MWQSCIKIYLEKSQFRTLGLKLMPTFVSGTGRHYETHFIVWNKYFKYLIHCLQFLCVIQKGGSVRHGEVCLKHLSDQIVSFGVGHNQLLVFLWRSAAEYSPLCVYTFSPSKRSLKKMSLVISDIDNLAKDNSILFCSSVSFHFISYYFIFVEMFMFGIYCFH